MNQYKTKIINGTLKPPAARHSTVRLVLHSTRGRARVRPLVFRALGSLASDVTDDLVLEMRGIRKEFPGVVANDDVSFDVRRGEVHALLGENGAGKSTLMNILYGLYRPDAGEIRLNGKAVHFSSARDAIQAGIGMVHQHFMLIPVMTVAENIVLGTEPGGKGSSSTRQRRTAGLATGEDVPLRGRPDALVQDISVGQQQRVEIMKALYRARTS